MKVLPVYLQYDFTLAFFASTGFLDGPQALVLSPGPLMMLYFDQVVHFTKGSRSYTFQIAYDILVTNKKNWQLFTTLVNQKLVWSFLSKRFSGFVVFKFREKRIKPLTHFAHLNGPIRKQAAIISFTFDLFIAFFVLGFGALLTFAVLWYSLAVVGPFYNSVLIGGLFLVDSSLAMYGLFNMIRIAFFFMHALHLIIFVHVQAQRAANHTLEQKLKLEEVANQGSRSRVNLARFLFNHYLPLNCRLIWDTLTTNRQFISSVLLFSLGCMFMLNVFAIASLALKVSLAFKEQMILLVVVGLQMLFLGLTTTPMMRLCDVIHQPTRELLYRSQMSTTFSEGKKGQALLLKLKLSSHYWTLSSGERFSPTVGPLGQVTRSAFFQVNTVFFNF